MFSAIDAVIYRAIATHTDVDTVFNGMMLTSFVHLHTLEELTIYVECRQVSALAGCFFLLPMSLGMQEQRNMMIAGQ